MFDEICKLVVPVAEAMAVQVKIEDQHIKKHIIKEVEVASATNLKIEIFEIKEIAMPIEDSYIDVIIRGCKCSASSTVKVAGINLDKVVVKLSIDILAKVKFDNVKGVLKSNVYDVKPTVTEFDIEIGHGAGGNMLERVTELFEGVIKSTIASSIAQPIDDALTQGLDSVLGRPLNQDGGVSGVNYRFLIDFDEEPTIVKGVGLKLILAVDALVGQQAIDEKRKEDEKASAAAGKENAAPK
ncbi:hypothetical protein HK101_004960 [Irineochytrium annulatum]|nr:hypothetical protein HK101_004960 [Irineochytrium annulatum]